MCLILLCKDLLNCKLCNKGNCLSHVHCIASVANSFNYKQADVIELYNMAQDLGTTVDPTD